MKTNLIRIANLSKDSLSSALNRFMSKSVFDRGEQAQNLNSKIVVGLERISEAFRVLLWQHAKILGLSPIQIQILIFVHYHGDELCNVSHLAQEFNMTKPTVSDAIKVLTQKELISKVQSPEDKRAYHVVLTKEGLGIVKETEGFAQPVANGLAKQPLKDKEQLFASISSLIHQLNQQDIISVQRMCYSCAHYAQKNGKHHCHLIGKSLKAGDIRLDCPEHLMG